jgi:broad specificity phosphatase PhoE/SAM-dependent methyltransferase
MTRRLLLIRHCESTGQSADAPLTERGMAQAASLAAQLAGLKPDLVVSSPFRRARESVEPLAAACRLRVEVDARLAEKSLTAEPLAEFREAVRRSFDDFDHRLPGGESSREAQTRGRELMDELLQRGARLPVVSTHGQLLTLLLNAIDPAAGYAVWQSLSNPDVFLIERAGEAAAQWQRDSGWTCTRLPPADAVATNAAAPSHDVREQYSETGNLQARIDLHRRFSANPYGWFRWIFDRLPRRATARLLDLGCGPGNLWAHNAARIPGGWSITLCDRFPAMIAAARRELPPHFRGLVGDAALLPFADRSFDCVVANHMLYHVENRQTALREIARVLDPDGCLVATTVGERHLAELDALLAACGVEAGLRGQSMTAPFTLENGGAQLARVFSEVALERYADELRVTEVEPVVAFLQSVVPARPFDAAAQAHIRATVGAAIAAHGRFTVGKDSGVFAARGIAAMVR